jgi:hypothetical protein
MERTEREIYNSNLDEYSYLVRTGSTDRDRILECIKMFEYFEDYEKCEHLLKILKDLDDGIKLF